MVIYYCEINNKCVHDELVSSEIYKTDFQPTTVADWYKTNKNEAEGNRVRNVLAMYFDP